MSTTPSTDRRTALKWLAVIPSGLATAQFTAACADPGSRRPSAAESAFAAPWADLADDAMSALGLAVRQVDPDAIDHARQRLATHDLATACRLDGDERRLTVVGLWLLPRTIAGLADALSSL